MSTCGVAACGEGYDGGDADGGETEIEGEVFVLDGDVGPRVVLTLREPGGMRVETLAVYLEGNH